MLSEYGGGHRCSTLFDVGSHVSAFVAKEGAANIPGPPPVLHKGNHPSVRTLQCQRGLSRQTAVMPLLRWPTSAILPVSISRFRFPVSMFHFTISTSIFYFVLPLPFSILCFRRRTYRTIHRYPVSVCRAPAAQLLVKAPKPGLLPQFRTQLRAPTIMGKLGYQKLREKALG